MTQNTARLSSALSDRYHLERELGAGGMATVYLAEDLRHRRKVALKVLRPELAAVIGADRFLKEIEVTANLQHPHILPLHDSGEADSFLFYVMPYVEGESLRARLERDRQLGIPEAIELTRQAANALDYAHRHGVIHRDIKPENILIHDGQALIADFGIALAVSTASGSRMTETGMSLGTPHYMSPEQAMGDRAVDARSDVYALGCVLYEMLVGEPPFTGPTAQAIVAKVITEKPSLVTATREAAPAHVAAAIQKALAKLPADRFASAAEFAEALVNPRFALEPTSTPAAVAAAALSRRLAALPWIVAAAAVGSAFWLGGLLLAPAAPPHPVVRMPLMPSDSVTARDGPGSPLAFSPDGSRIAFLGVDAQRTSRIFLRLLDRVDPVPMPGTESANQPFFSPDGQWIGFHQEGKLRKVAMAGGSVATIAETGNLQGASWGADDRIVYSSRNRLWRVPAAGGRPELLAEPDSGASVAYRWPDVLPGGRAAVFTRVADHATLATLSLSDGKITELGQPGMSPRYVDGGFLAFVQSDGTLFGARFDPRRLRLNNAPEPIAEGIRLGPASVAKLAVSKTGAIAYLVGVSAAQREVVILDREGQGKPLPLRPERYGTPRFSPDGRQIAVAVIQPGPILTSDIWTWNIARRTMSRLTFDTSSGFPEWSPDGKRILYTRRLGQGRIGVFWVASDGSGISDTLLVRTSLGFGGRLTPDGRHFVFQEIEGALSGGVSPNSNVWIAPVDTPEAARPLLQNRFNEGSPAISPDGQWLAYQSNESGANEIYVRRLHGGGGRVQVSTSGGTNPRWRPHGLELMYRDTDSLYAVSVRPETEPTLGAPHALFALTASLGDYDIHPDGRRFAFIREQSRDAEGLGIVLNWFENRQTRRR